MAAYRWVDDLLQADCLYTGISSGPNAQYRVWEAFTFTFMNYLSDEDYSAVEENHSFTAS